MTENHETDKGSEGGEADGRTTYQRSRGQGGQQGAARWPDREDVEDRGRQRAQSALEGLDEEVAIDRLQVASIASRSDADRHDDRGSGC
jgi:hypothetical protein